MNAVLSTPESMTSPGPDDSAMGRRPRRRILVAVDGSPASVDALRWVRDELLVPDDLVRVVTAYQFAHYATEVPLMNVHVQESAEHARAAGEAAIDTVFGPRGWRPEIDHVVDVGCIERLVERESETATLVVVGSRSRRRLRDRLRPSATNRITGRASCPVVSVPERSHGCGTSDPSPGISDLDHAH